MRIVAGSAKAFVANQLMPTIQAGISTTRYLFLQATLSAAASLLFGRDAPPPQVFSYFFAVGRKSEVLGLDLSGLATYRDLAAYMSCLSYSIVENGRC